ncbi:Proteasome subunit beta type-5 [Rhodotorula toruloides]
MDKLVQRYAKSPVTSAYSSRRYAQEDIASEEYGYALPLGRGIERCPAPNFEMPATVDPTSFLQLHTDDASDPSCRININHGTTTLAFKFQVGIVVAVDSRATTGSYIADCQYWETYLGIQSRLHELRNHKRISVTATSEDLGCWHNNLGDLTYRPAAGGRRGYVGFHSLLWAALTFSLCPLYFNLSLPAPSTSSAFATLEPWDSFAHFREAALRESSPSTRLSLLQRAPLFH